MKKLNTTLFCVMFYSLIGTPALAQSSNQACFVKQLNKTLGTSYKQLPSPSKLDYSQIKRLKEKDPFTSCVAIQPDFGAHAHCCGANFWWMFGYCKGQIYSASSYYCENPKSSPYTICPINPPYAGPCSPPLNN